MSTQRKNRFLPWIIYFVIFFVAVQGASWWKSRNAMNGDLSDFTGELTSGSSFSIEEFSGKPVLVHFWATWCAICDLEKNSVESISHDYPVISVASWSEGESEVKAYMQKNQLSFPVMLDNSGEVAQSFGLKGVPANFILAPNGEIEYVETGYSTELGLRLRLWLASL